MLDRVGDLIGKKLSEEVSCNLYKGRGFVKLPNKLFQSRGAYLKERYVAKKIVARSRSSKEFDVLDSEKYLIQWEAANFKLTADQRKAVI
ncbi:MAG: hypothetical protein WBA20_02960, partial [Ketobacter sp.]